MSTRSRARLQLSQFVVERLAPTRVCVMAATLMCTLATACRPPAPAEAPAKPEPRAPQSEAASSIGSPWNATYLLDGRRVTLVDGRARLTVAPGSAATMEIARIGDAAPGDIDTDGDADAAFSVRQDSGGSGVFYYVAAALADKGAYSGVNLVLLGDRLVVEDVALLRGVIVVRFLDRRAEEPMSARPSVPRLAFTTLESGRLQPLIVLGEGEQLLDALVTLGHEARTMQPCASEKDAWISGSSPALRTLLEEYGRARRGAAPYAPLLMVLTGRMGDARGETGFGADYDSSFIATRLVRSLAQETC